MGSAVLASDDRRVGIRIEVDRAAVLRTGDRSEPITIENLTRHGCRFRSDAELPLDAVSIGIAGVGHTPARLAWRQGRTYGCAFDRPLPASAVTPAEPDNVARFAPLSSGEDLHALEELYAVEEPVERLPVRTRVVLVAAINGCLWAGIIGLVRALF